MWFILIMMLHIVTVMLVTLSFSSKKTTSFNFVLFTEYFYLEKRFTCDDFLQTTNILTFVSRKNHVKIPNKMLIFEYYVLFLNLINLHSYICIFCLVSFFLLKSSFLQIISSGFQISTIKSSLQDAFRFFFVPLD